MDLEGKWKGKKVGNNFSFVIDILNLKHDFREDNVAGNYDDEDEREA